MTDHVISVGPVATPAGASSGVPAYAYRCTCGAVGAARVAVATMTGRVTSKARNEAREDATRDALTHQREANAREVKSA